MDSSKISFTVPKSFIEPVAFLVIVAFAGSKRFIQYLPGATRGGLLLAGGIPGIACSAHDYMYKGENRSLLKKSSAIAISTIVSLAITGSIKRRVYLSIRNNLKISSLFYSTSLIKLFYLDSKSQPKRHTSTNEKLMKLIPGAKSATIKINSGQTDCLNYRESPKGLKASITLQDHVYEVDNGPGKTALLMTKEDFLILYNICHGGAFGSDYKELQAHEIGKYGLKGIEKKSYMILWKIPADLKSVRNYVLDKNKLYTAVDVGSYRLSSDMASSKISAANMTVLQALQCNIGTKIRSDFSEPIPPLSSVHHLQVLGTDVPGISTCFFFENFNGPTGAEHKKVQEFLDMLAENGIGAYLCNSSQHMVIIGSFNGEAITAKGLANLFQDDEKIRTIVLDGFREAAIPKWKESVISWQDFYARRFLGEKQT